MSFGPQSSNTTMEDVQPIDQSIQCDMTFQKDIIIQDSETGTNLRTCWARYENNRIIAYIDREGYMEEWFGENYPDFDYWVYKPD
jgi:hypothetical protein